MKRAGEAALWVVIVLATAIILLVIVYLSKAHASDEIQLPFGITCDLIRVKVAEHGRIASFAWAIRNGYSLSEIRQAKRCLINPPDRLDRR